MRPVMAAALKGSIFAMPQRAAWFLVIMKSIRPKAHGGRADRTDQKLTHCLSVKSEFCPVHTATLHSRHTESVTTWDGDCSMWSVLSQQQLPLLMRIAGER